MVNARNGQAYYDDAHVETCDVGITKCFKQTIEGNVNSYPVKTVSGGCLRPRAEAFLNNQPLMESYFPEGSTFSSFDFETCTTSNCLDLSEGLEGKLNVSFWLHKAFVMTNECIYIAVILNWNPCLLSDSEETLVCYKGLTVEEGNQVIFSNHKALQCKITDYCQTVTFSKTERATRKKRKYSKSIYLLATRPF